MRLAFMGTPDFAVPILEALVDAGHDVARVYAQPARPTGRGHKVQASPVERRAVALGLPVATPESLKPDEVRQAFASLDLEAAVVAAYGQLLPKAMLAAPRLGCINVHASLLPRWRGAAPIQRAILAGDTISGVSIMQMTAGLDTGPVLLTGSVPIAADETTATLQARLATLGARLIIEALDGVEAGRIRAREQPVDGVTYATKLDRAEGALDWRRSAIENERKVRALNPSPGVWFLHGGERIKVLEAMAEPGTGTPGIVMDSSLRIACGQGILRPTRLQRAGRAPVAVDAFLNGMPIAAGTSLTCPATS
jgi:methionyl-tRNA formyltransferase